jgi:NAD(P)-dependent dehydrogenase (short-subunit alcohol dehydrogenase family)
MTCRDRHTRCASRSALRNVTAYPDSIVQNEATIARIPMGRQAGKEEIANTIAFLLSADTGYITGQNLRVDGGITRSV